MKLLTYKCIDVMKKSKDTLTSQLTTAEKQNLVACLALTGITHIAISVPLDDNSVWVAAGSTPSPRSAEAEVADWCDVIHAQLGLNGNPLKVLHRGTFGGVENIFSVPFDTATPVGTAASAPTDVNTTWLGRWYRYLTLHVGSHVISGDIFAPVPEGATLLVQGSPNSWLSQANYALFFIRARTVTNTWAATQGVSVVFMSHNNFSDVASGWLFGSVTSDQNIVGCDYYGQRGGTLYNFPSNYKSDWQNLYLGKDVDGVTNTNNSASLDQFWGEWGDLPGAMPATEQITPEKWARYLINFYKSIRDNLVTPNGHLIGFNYWGGWEGQNTSLLYKTGSGASSQYFLNFRGQILREFFVNNGMSRIPVIQGGSSAHTYYF